MADDPLSDEGRLATILGCVDLALAGLDPERARTLIDFALLRIASRKPPEPRRPTPPPRPISQTMPAATAPTTRHNIAAIVAESEDALPLEQRDTPVATAPFEITRRHPTDDR